jgi:hypothetical protein
MVGLGGLEPPTSPLSGARSSHLSYRPIQALRKVLTAPSFYDALASFATVYKTPYLCTRQQSPCHFAFLFMRKGRVVAWYAQTRMSLWRVRS